MNKTAILTGIVCFLTGAGFGFLSAPKSHGFDVNGKMLTELTSQGRAEIRKMISEIAYVLEKDAASISAEETMSLQAITARNPDRNAADFYLSGVEDKRKAVQTKIDKILLDAIERMPLMDRRTYMKFHLKNRSYLKGRHVVLPLIVTLPSDETTETPS